ncbi:hypothetical protein HD806DRAFT_23962 [Xylariaceae sp. AK1471]|nr:hypothetical protein HD806DRAFT_23962 [Xylariaceae sp. AK1471]
MGVQQSQPVLEELPLNGTDPSVQEQVICSQTPHVLRQVETEHALQPKSSLITAYLPASNQASSSTPISLSSPPTTSDQSGTNKINDGASPQTALTVVSSDDEDDLLTLLRKHRKARAAEETNTVIRQDDWKSLDIEWWSHLKGPRDKSYKAGKPAGQPKARRRPSPDDNQPKVGIRRTKRQAQSQRSGNGQHTAGTQKSEPQTRRRPDNGQRRINGQKTKTQTKSSHKAKPSSLARFRVDRRQIDRNLQHRSDSEPAMLRPRPARNPIARIDRNFTYQSDTEPSTSRPQKGRNVVARVDQNAIFTSNNESATPRAQQSGNIVARFDRNLIINSKTEQNALRTPQDTHVVARVDRNLTYHSDTEPARLISQQEGYNGARVGRGNFVDTPSVPGPGVNSTQFDNSRFLAPTGNSNANRLRRPPPASNNHQNDDLFRKLDRAPLPRSQSEEREAALIQAFERQQQQRPREYVVPDLKWGYAIKCVDNADMLLDEEDQDARAVTIRTFADREKANEYLDKNTTSEKWGGLEAIVSRTATLEGPERFLKVDIALSDGERHIMWVERGMVVLRNLSEKQRKQVQWAPNPRPTFPHYVVTCDLITYETNPVTLCDDVEDDDEDDAMSLSDQFGKVGTSGLAVKLGIEKFPLTTFTIREMANAYAGKLFLEKSTVHKQFAETTDVQWWELNAWREHEAAEARTGRPDGLYEISMEAHDMNCLLGWDEIVVHVHEVDDVTGPVNF